MNCTRQRASTVLLLIHTPLVTRRPRRHNVVASNINRGAIKRFHAVWVSSLALAPRQSEYIITERVGKNVENANGSAEECPIVILSERSQAPRGAKVDLILGVPLKLDAKQQEICSPINRVVSEIIPAGTI